MFTILQGKNVIATVETDAEVLNWFHENLGSSMYHAARYMDYTIQHDSGRLFYA